ncbi:hypothetical protein BDR26DRAFT_915369 [Obelidium mucronatum]|nr:hypothetical protein BDR26DRAFT_915369 [Obelidium mucronatum]
MFDLLSKKSYSSDTAEVRTLIIKLVDAKYKVMNACSPDDRMKAIEIMDDLEAKNANHMNHLSNSSSSSYSSPSSSVTSFGGNILPALTIPQPTVKQPTSSNYYQPLPFHPNQNHQQYLVGGNTSQNSGERAQPSRPQDLESRFRHAISRISTLAASSSATQEVNELCTISWLLSQSSNPSERDGFRQKLNECKTRLLDYVSRNGQEEDRVFLLRAFDEFCLNRW